MPARKTTKKKGREKRHELAESLRVSLRERFGVCAGERIGVAVSGGADSVALLRLLIELREELGVVLCVAHFNHKLRGKASGADEQFVARLAAQHGLEFFIARENVAEKARRERANLEDAARRARYAYFEQLVTDERVSRIAVAQTADDQAETVLAHILRGTGRCAITCVAYAKPGARTQATGMKREHERVSGISFFPFWRNNFKARLSSIFASWPNSRGKIILIWITRLNFERKRLGKKLERAFPFRSESLRESKKAFQKEAAQNPRKRAPLL